MRKYAVFLLLLFVLFSQLQVGGLYAAELEKLAQEKQKSEKVLEKVEDIIDAGVEKIEKRTKNRSIKKNLHKKTKEIKEYLDNVKEDIKTETSQKDIKDKVEEAKKVVVLKVVAGTTQFENVEDNLDVEIVRNKQEKKQAVKALQNSLKDEKGDYNIIVKTKYSLEKTKKLFATFDENIRLEKMYHFEGETYFEVFIEENSIFRQEMFEDIEAGILPESFIGIKIILPEIFSIEKLDLSGENISKTWGVEKYQSYKFLDVFAEKSKKIKVAVIDTGIDYTHPDLSQNVNKSLGKDFVNNDNDAYDDQGHGTHVAGTIAANVNGAGIIGVNPYVELVPLKICTERGFCPTYAVLKALEYAKDKEIDILNMSLGGRGNPSEHAICSAIASVVDSGGIVVAASGNSNIHTSRFVPGGCSKALSVAAIDAAGKRATFSNYGGLVDVAAPGVNIYSTYPVNKGSFKKLSGTSMATPHIAGIVSLLRSQKPNITVEEVQQLFSSYGKQVETEKGKEIAKALNVEALLASLQKKEAKNEENITQKNEEENSKNIEKDKKPVEKEDKKSPEKPKAVKQDDPEADNYEVLLDTITYIDTKIDFIKDQKTQDHLIEKQNAALESSESIKIQNVKLVPSSIDLSIFPQSIELNSSFTGASETGSIIPELASDLDIGEDRVPESQIFSASGELLPETQINTIDSQEEKTSGSKLPDGMDVFNLPERSVTPDFSSIEINNIEPEKESQELFIDGAEKGVQINSTGDDEGKDLDFLTGSADSQEEPIFDINGNVANPDEGIETLTGSSPQYLQDAIVYREIIEEVPEGVESGTGEMIEVSADYIPPKGSSEERIGIQNTYSCEVFPGQICSYRIFNAYGYQFHDSKPGVATTSASRKYLYITGKSVGETTFKMYMNNNLIHIINVKIKERKPIEKYTEIYAGATIALGDCKYSRYIYTPSAVGKFYTSGPYCYFQALSAGNIDILLKNSDRYSYMNDYLHKIKVLPIPTPKEYTLKFIGGSGNANVYLPEKISDFRVYREGAGIYDKVRAYEKHFYIDVERVGTAKIILKDKKYGFTRYIIHVVSEPEYKDFQLNETDYIYAWSNDNYRFHVTDQSIVEYNTNKNYGYLHGKKAGETDIRVMHNQYGLRKLWKVKVLPKPQPIEVHCETQVGKQCILRTQNGGYYYETNIKYGNYEVRSWKDKFYFKSERSGEYTAYIKSYYGNYVTHILKIKVLPPVAKVVKCDMAVGGFCDLGTTFTNERDLRFQETQGGLVKVHYKRDSNGGTHTKGNTKNHNSGMYDHDYKNIEQGFRYKIHYRLETLKVGRGDIYIYEKGEHLYTVKINAFVVNPIKLEDDSLKVKQGEIISSKILDGGGRYKAKGVYSSSGVELSIDHFDVDFDKNPEGFYLPTGNVSLRNTRIGRFYPVIIDRYNQVKQISLSILDADLRLSEYIPPNLRVGEYYNIHVLDRYQKIVKMEQTQKDGSIDTKNILSYTYVRDVRNKQEYIRIKGLKAGKTVLRITDAEGNQATIDVTIAGEEVVDNENPNASNLIKNGNFAGGGIKSGPGWAYMSGKENIWGAHVHNSGEAELKDNMLRLSVKGNNSYVESRNTDGGYFGVTPESIKVKPNTKYVLEFDYKTQHHSGDSANGFDVGILTSSSHGVSSGEFKVLGFVKNTRPFTHVRYELTTSNTAQYLNISPLIYGHTGAKTLNMEAWVKNMKLKKAVNSQANTLDNILREIFTQLNVAYEGNIGVASAPDATLCELGNTGNFWARPMHAVCVEGSFTEAWKCKDSYIDMSFTGYNSCVKNTFSHQTFENKKQAIDNSIGKLKNYLSSYAGDDKKLKAISEKVTKLQGTFNNTSKNADNIATLNIILDEFKHEITKKYSHAYVDLSELLATYQALVLSSNKGKHEWGDGTVINPLYQNKTRAEIEAYAQKFSTQLFEYNFKYNPDFKQKYNQEVQRLKALGGDTTTIEKGLKDGAIEGTKDYLMSYYNAAKSLISLQVSDIQEGFSSLWSKVTNPVKTLSSSFDNFKQTIQGIYDKLTVLTGYEAGKGSGYVGSTIGISTVDPTAKLAAAVGGGFFVKVSGKITNLKYASLAKLLKPIKSINLTHINADHKFGVNNTKSKYLQGADIEGLIREGYSKKGKRIAETNSEVNGKTIPSIKIEVDMGRKVGTNANGGGDFMIMRIIVDYDGNIISAFPVGSYQIK